MINLEQFEDEIKKNKIANSYVFCGLDEELIKESINSIVKRIISKESIDLNLIKLDGLQTTCQEIENACETMSFFQDKKVVVVYRANFLREKTDREGSKVYTEVSNYVKNMTPDTILIMYYLFNDKRETPKKNKKLLNLDKHMKVVHCDKLKKDRYYKKIEDMFRDKGRAVGKIQVKYFADKVPNNFDIIKREIEKLDSYAWGREITKEDIDKYYIQKAKMISLI